MSGYSNQQKKRKGKDTGAGAQAAQAHVPDDGLQQDRANSARVDAASDAPGMAGPPHAGVLDIARGGAAAAPAGAVPDLDDDVPAAPPQNVWKVGVSPRERVLTRLKASADRIYDIDNPDSTEADNPDFKTFQAETTRSAARQEVIRQRRDPKENRRWFGRRNNDEPKSGRKQLDALRAYSGPAYGPVNRFLRQGSVTLSDNELRDMGISGWRKQAKGQKMVRKIAKHAQRALMGGEHTAAVDAAGKKKELTVHRGELGDYMRQRLGEGADYGAHDVIGSDKGLTSTSLSQRQASIFAKFGAGQAPARGPQAPKRTMIHANVPAGVPTMLLDRNLSRHPTEREMVIRPDQPFRIMEDRQGVYQRPMPSNAPQEEKDKNKVDYNDTFISYLNADMGGHRRNPPQQRPEKRWWQFWK